MIAITFWNQIMMRLFYTQVNQHFFYRIAITSLGTPGVEKRRGPGSSWLLEIQEDFFSFKSGSPVAPYTCHDLDRG